MLEHWATYSVKDHLAERAFVADIMQYDRIVVPYPPDQEERARWAKNGWNPDRLDKLLEIIGPDRYQKKEWDPLHKQKWQDRIQEAGSLYSDAFGATRFVLTQDLPKYVTGVQADLAYSDAQALADNTGLRKSVDAPYDINAELAVVLGKRFLAPSAKTYPDPEGALRSALELSSDRDFQRKRNAYYRWQREFLKVFNRQNTILDADDRKQVITKAVEEMQDLIADEERVLRKSAIRTNVLFAFKVVGTGLALTDGLTTPVGMLGAFVSIGSFIVDSLPAPNLNEPRPASFFTSAQRHFNWTAPEE